MIKKENFSKAYKEIYVIIDHLNESDKNKIPKEFINMIETQMDKNHVFNYDDTKDLSEQNVLRETLSILAYIYIHYIGEYQDVKEIKTQFQKDIIEHEMAKKALYEKNNTNDIFKNTPNTKKQTNSEVNSTRFEQEVSLIDSKQDKWYSKILTFFKNIFK